MELDQVLAVLGDERIFKGRSVEELSKLVASLEKSISPPPPALRRGGRVLLPRTLLCVTAWRKFVPTAQRCEGDGLQTGERRHR